MKYKRYTVNAPADIAEMIDKRIPEIPYTSDSAYFLGLAIYDLWCRRPHKYTANLMAAPPAIRDEAFEKLAERFKSRGPSEKPGYFDTFIQQIVDEALAKAKAEAEKTDPSPKPKKPAKRNPRKPKD